MVFARTKVVNIGQQGNRALLFVCFWFNWANHHSETSAITDYWCKFSPLDQHPEINQLWCQSMAAHLINKTSYWRKKLFTHLNWAIYNACDLNIDTYVCFSRTLSHDRDQPTLLAQPEDAEAIMATQDVVVALQWRHNDPDGVSNHQPRHCLLTRLFRRRSKKNFKAPRHWPLCAGNSPVTGEFPAQMASNAENVSIWWRHHVCVHLSITSLSTW